MSTSAELISLSDMLARSQRDRIWATFRSLGDILNPLAAKCGQNLTKILRFC